MKRNLERMLAAAGLFSVAAAGGCVPYRNAVDPCWPERYNHTARRETIDAFAPQVQNGHVLDQTIWNYMFAMGTDELNPTGKFKLDYIIRRRPQPDGNVFLQTAHDVQFNVQEPEKLAETRRELDQKRAAAIRQYLNAQTVGRPMAFEVAVHDPFEVGGSAIMAPGQTRLANSVGTSILGGAGASSGGGAASTGTGASSGTGTGSYGGQSGTGTGSGSGSGSSPTPR